MFAAAQGNCRAAGSGNVLGALGQQLQGGIKIALGHFGQRLPAILSRKARLSLERGSGILAGNRVVLHGAVIRVSLAEGMVSRAGT